MLILTSILYMNKLVEFWYWF